MRGFDRIPMSKPRMVQTRIGIHGGSMVLEVRSGDGIVFLDLDEDEYSCCYEPKQPIRDYVGLIEPASSNGLDRSRSVLTSRWTDTEQWDFPRPGIRHIVRFVFALTKARIQFRDRSLADLAFAAGRLGARKRHGSITAQQASNLFRYLLSLTPFHPKCLFGSFALLHFLDRYGLGADWVFGAQLFPFRAHCWLASDGMLLNELRHRIEDYEVIWTVGQGRR
jgi:hypothetical protein